jgi:hypothetical protein
MGLELAFGINSPNRRWSVVVAIVVAIFVVLLGISAFEMFVHPVTYGQLRSAEWKEEPAGCYRINYGPNTKFRFDGHSDRVLVGDTPQFHFGTNQDFSVEAWIKAYPSWSPLAQKLQVWLQTHPATIRFTPRWLDTWISTHSINNDFGVTCIVSKSLAASTIEATGFEFCLNNGRLACQLAQAPMRQLGFQNFISPSADLQDAHWHHVAMTVQRTSASGGKLYVDGKQVLIFDPTAQAGDLSNSEPLRIGNHSNPNLRCFFKGAIAGVALHRESLSAREVSAIYRTGRSK